MNMAERIQTLRKTKGISQEELAEQAGVSRQAVSKWESGQSTPDLEKVISMSEYFQVSTDYILKGIEPGAEKGKAEPQLISKILYLASTALVFIGLFCAFGGWYEKQTMGYVWGAMMIQAVGVAGYFAGKLLSSVRPPIAVSRLNIIGCLFIPVSMISGIVSVFVFRRGWVAPYPIAAMHIILFLVIYVSSCAAGFAVIRKYFI